MENIINEGSLDYDEVVKIISCKHSAARSVEEQAADKMGAFRSCKVLAKTLTETYKVDVLPLCFDVRNKVEVQAAIASLPEKWTNIDVLLNNAGLASGLDKIQNGKIEDWETMIDTNVKGLLYVTHEIIPFFIKNKQII